MEIEPPAVTIVWACRQGVDTARVDDLLVGVLAVYPSPGRAVLGEAGEMHELLGEPRAAAVVRVGAAVGRQWQGEDSRGGGEGPRDLDRRPRDAARAQVLCGTLGRLKEARHGGDRGQRRRRPFKLSTDPQFIEKLRDVVGVYLNPPQAAVVFCVDEKSQIQAIDRTQPAFPILPGTPARRTHDHEIQRSRSPSAVGRRATGVRHLIRGEYRAGACAGHSGVCKGPPGGAPESDESTCSVTAARGFDSISSASASSGRGRASSLANPPLQQGLRSRTG
jgi:hypothetical protein